MSTRTPAPAADAEWDAGDLGCGELVLELRARHAGDGGPARSCGSSRATPARPPTSRPGAG